MNTKLLIDAIVHQTMVLIAQLATAAGLRAPLTHIANQVFLELVQELEAQGVGRKIIADMFGLALRSYQLKVKRISESLTDSDRTLWEAVFDHIQQQGVCSRAELLRRFCRDDSASVRSVLHDLVETSLVFKSGRGDATLYRASSDEELGRVAPSAESAQALVWITIYRAGEVRRAELDERLQLEDGMLAAALTALEADGRVQRDDEGRYRSAHCVIPMGEAAGWEAAVFDHFQAMVTALCVKLRERSTRAQARDVVGGSTYSFLLWPGHPYEERVLGLLAEARAQTSTLRAEVTGYNTGRVEAAPDDAFEVTFYVGQSLRRDDDAP